MSHTPKQSFWHHPFWKTLIPYILVGIVALLLRVPDLGLFVTHDEAEFWIDRSEQFLIAIQQGDYAGTAISTHPGVTTMWLGMIGIFLRRILRAWHIVQEVPFPLLLALMRLPVLVAHVAGLLVSYHFLRRLFPLIIATFAALLWATDPFIIGYSRLLHVDALAGTFITWSLLAACVYWFQERRRVWLIWSGVGGGLAILSKSPALILVPMIGLIALSNAVQHYQLYRAEMAKNEHQQHIPIITLVRSLALPFLAWGAIVGITILLLFPAVWADPMRVYELFRIGVEVEGASPHMTGNFFLGQATPIPDIRFYPVVLALRSTPWSLVGVLLLPVALWGLQKWRRREYHGDTETRSPSRREEELPIWSFARTLALLTLFILLFTVAMSIFPKKFNRYLVPVFPVFDILAAVGIVGTFSLLVGKGDKFVGAQRAVPPVRQSRTEETLHATSLQNKAHPKNPHLKDALLRFVISLIVTTGIINTIWFQPYQIVYFNQLLGGVRAGAYAFSLGWGEGYDQVAQWLNQRSDITGVVTASIMIKSLNPYLRYGAQATTPKHDELPKKSGYVVVYIYQAQGTIFPPFNQFYQQYPPLHTVNIHGVDYAWIYQVPPPVHHSHPAQFGDTIQLRGYAIETVPQRGQEQLYTLYWKNQQLSTPNYWMFVHVIGPDGKRYYQADIPYCANQCDEANLFTSTELPVIIPRDAPEGQYHIVLGVYDPENDKRIPLKTSLPVDPLLDGPDALVLETWKIP